jgi:hypothetical protein
MFIPHSPSLTTDPKRYDFTRNPMLVYWEMTQACMLACRHCRAEAMPSPHPLELTPIESMGLLCQVAAFGDPLPHLILTGGDPLCRKDLFRVIDDARALGLQVSITPSATPALSVEALNRLRSLRYPEPRPEPRRLVCGPARCCARHPGMLRPDNRRGTRGRTAGTAHSSQYPGGTGNRR